MAFVVMAHPTLTRDLLTRAVTTPTVRDSVEVVALLVNPTGEEWDRARELQARIVLMDRRVVMPEAVADAILLGGAEAVLDPNSSLQEVRETVDRVATGGTVLNELAARVLAERARAMRPRAAPHLTPREHEILECLEQGQSIKQTARHLGLARKTVENLRGRLFRKLGARNAGHALVKAAGLGVLTDGRR